MKTIIYVIMSILSMSLACNSKKSKSSTPTPTPAEKLTVNSGSNGVEREDSTSHGSSSGSDDFSSSDETAGEYSSSDSKPAESATSETADPKTAKTSDLEVTGRKFFGFFSGSYELTVNQETVKFPTFGASATFKNVCTDGETTISVAVTQGGKTYRPSMLKCFLGTGSMNEVTLGFSDGCWSDSIYFVDSAIATFTCPKGNLIIKDLHIDPTINVDDWN